MMWGENVIYKNFKAYLFLLHCMWFEAFKPDLLEVSSLGLYDYFY